MKHILSIIALSCTLSASAQTYTLQQLKDSALQNNIAIRTARHSIDAAQQQRKEAFTKFFPSVSGTGFWFNANKGMAQTEVNLSEQLSPELGTALAQSLPAEALAALGSPIGISMLKNGTIGSLMAVQPVFAGGQIINGNKLAKVGEDVSRLQLQLSENEVEKQTEQYYWQMVSLQEKMKTIEAVQALLADIYKDVDVAVLAGLAMRNDLLQVQLRQNDVESQKLKLQNGISILRLLLAQYCGLKSESWNVECGMWNENTPTAVNSTNANSASDISHSAFHIPHSTKKSFHNPPSTLLGPLPEYQLLQKQVEATKLQKNMEIGKNLPTVGVGAGYNYHNLLDNNHTFGMVFATVSVPISDWWGGSHAIKQKKIEQQKAEEQLANNSELLKIRMQKAWNDVEESRQQIQIALHSIEQAEENLRLNRDYYRAGTSKMSDLLEAQLLYQQSLDRHTDAFADYQNKLLEYRQATGQ
jgi:outer membrane protein TolC